ncbi:MAG: hypothetical protein M0R17_05585 [Candidatus Omnitrophica bacterium]|jgi:hypothetical protein|nr:hypothetical protein [Candidatus Omnitrophota bacterium]
MKKKEIKSISKEEYIRSGIIFYISKLEKETGTQIIYDIKEIKELRK